MIRFGQLLFPDPTQKIMNKTEVPISSKPFGIGFAIFGFEWNGPGEP